MGATTLPYPHQRWGEKGYDLAFDFVFWVEPKRRGVTTSDFPTKGKKGFSLSTCYMLPNGGVARIPPESNVFRHSQPNSP